MIIKKRTGHQNYNTDKQSYSCGTCSSCNNSKNCKYCVMRYEVVGLKESFLHEFEAEIAEKKFLRLIPVDSFLYDKTRITYTVDNGVLYAKIFIFGNGKNGLLGHFELIKCNPYSPDYNEMFNKTKDHMLLNNNYSEPKRRRKVGDN